MKVFLNDQFLGGADARVPHDDAGFQHAVGLFETLSASNGVVFRLDAHLQRLQNSAAELGLTRTLDTNHLRQAVYQTLTANDLSDARIRLTVTAGSTGTFRSSNPDDPPAPPKPTVLVVATPPTQYDPSYFEKGIMAILGPPLANPFDPLAGHKTLSYWSRLRLLRQAAAAQAGEVILLNITNHLASGTVSNLFLVKGNKLLTPFAHGEEVEGALPAPVLPGITRAAVLELAQQAGLPIEKRMLSVDDLLSADEVFLTNSSWHILPVTRIEKHPIAAASVGPITQHLKNSLVETIFRESQAGSEVDSKA